MAHGGDDKYYDPSNKVVHNGDTANAADLNAINTTIDVALETVANDLDTLENNTLNWSETAEKWATDPVGTNPNPVKPTKYSAEANATEAENWASAAGTVVDSTGVDTGEKSAKTLAGEAVTSAAASTTAQGLAEVAQGLAEDAEDAALISANLAFDYKDQASAFSISSSGYADQSEVHALKSEKWAEEAEDVEVEVGSYSSLHWAAKAATYAGSMTVENDCINGTFEIWQRGITQTTNSGYYSDDRWSNTHAASTKVHTKESFTAGQTVVPGNPKYYSKTVVTSVAASFGFVIKSHKILDVTKYSGKVVCLSFYAKADAAKDIAIDTAQDFGSGGSITITGIDVKTISLSTTWEKHTVFISIPSVSGKTIGTSSNTGFYFWFDAGSDYDARTNFLGQQSGTFEISEVEVYVSDIELPVRRRTAEEELSLCQAYYWQGTLPGLGYGYRLSGGTSVSGVGAPEVCFPVTMVGQPALSIVTAGGYANCGHASLYGDKHGFVERLNAVPTNTYYRVTAGIYAADAEL